jgi:ribosomal protein L22
LLPRSANLILTEQFSFKVRYAAQHIENGKSARSRGSYLRVSFKNTRETAQAINGWKVDRALKYLENVQELKEVVPMRRYAGGTGRSAQGEFRIKHTLQVLFLDHVEMHNVEPRSTAGCFAL